MTGSKSRCAPYSGIECFSMADRMSASILSLARISYLCRPTCGKKDNSIFRKQDRTITKARHFEVPGFCLRGGKVCCAGAQFVFCIVNDPARRTFLINLKKGTRQGTKHW